MANGYVEDTTATGNGEVDNMKGNLLGTVFSPVKIFSHMERMYDWWRGENIYPITVELGPSGPANCNNNCNFCMHRNYYDAEAVMDFKLYKRIIDELKELEVRGMVFSSSGEPLTNPEIIDFIIYTKEAGIDVALVTNGTALQRPGLIEAIAKDLTWTRISLDAGTSETRAKIHGVGVEDFPRVLQSLRMLAEEKEKVNSSCHIGAQMVVTQDNWWEVYEATRFVRNSGIDYFQIKPVVFHPKDGVRQLPRRFWETALLLINATKRDFENERFDVFVKYDQFGAIMAPDYEKSAYSKCRANFFPVIEATGKIYHCSQKRGLPDFELGDLTTTSFKEIWHSERRKKIIENIDVSACQLVCRCHWLNKMLKTVALGENAPSFV